ncbi:methyltransferase-like protein 5 [Salpingoeca rosetta]|uniref:Methyltransferase-like protein 5 n=1 Tax=Salpingoeca rosetta (strain ATCC 50818 / BSB-021) TaxID=946362 RepID=F2UHY9_SALR5|nr:methyltransferase-like protein 5 [Salpingoeca rosetta]EGD76738.1 methyltransferase-like protein 5 [Salpingoeca rosetta]|eukprot:XP_004991110.1 methyltransferase-like protein 5 [Salpingoeca rosetta]
MFAIYHKRKRRTGNNSRDMRLKELEGYLQQVRSFEEPKVLLEQYPTSAHIAAHLLYTMDSTYGDVEDKVVCDFGVGGGILSIGAIMLGAGMCIGCDIDDDALEIARANADEFEIDNLELLRVDVGTRHAGHLPPLPIGSVDTVIMNPPFGTKKNAGIDMNFLEQASRICTGAIYSLNKTSTRAFIQRKCRSFGLEMEVVAELRYDIPQMYKFHKKKSVDVEVDFLRFTPTADDS